MGSEDGWETIKRRRPRRAPAVPRGAVKARGMKDERGREEVLGDFERARKRWRREWEGLACREGLGRILRRVRADLGVERNVVREGGDEPRMDGGEPAKDGEPTTDDSTNPDPADKPLQGTEKPGDAENPRWPRRPSGLSCAVCLGLGSFEDEGWEVVRRTWVQYFAFLAIVEALDPSLPVLFQEPDFTPGDKIFLEEQGHVVLDDPAGFEAIARDPGGAVVVGFHLYVPIYRRALEGGLPRVFVGTGWDVWDNINKGDVIPALKSMDETHWSEAFPQDQTLSTFSSPNIYWRPGTAGARDEGEAGRDEEDVGDKDEGASKDGGAEVEGDSKHGGPKGGDPGGDTKDTRISKGTGGSKDEDSHDG